MNRVKLKTVLKFIPRLSVLAIFPPTLCVPLNRRRRRCFAPAAAVHHRPPRAASARTGPFYTPGGKSSQGPFLQHGTQGCPPLTVSLGNGFLDRFRQMAVSIKAQ